MLFVRERFIYLTFVFVVFVSANSFAQTAATTSSPTPDATSTSDLKKLSLEELMNMDVTSVAKQPEPYGQAPAAIDVITNDEIRRSGASSIPEALRLADNLDVAQVSSSGWNISARGFNTSVSDKLLVLMDGRSVYTPLFAGVIWNIQDYLLADIDRIEVISGPGGTLWGANAVNGVINITSKKAEDTQGVYFETGGGTQLQDLVAARYGGMLDKGVYYRVYGKYFERGNEDFVDGVDAQDNWNRGQGGFRLDADGDTQDRFTLQGDLSDGDSNEIPGGEGMTPAQGNSADGNILGRWTRSYSADSDMTLQFYYDHTHLAVPFQGAPAQPAFGSFFPASPAIQPGTMVDDLDTFDLDFHYRFPVGTWNHIIWGMGYRYTYDVNQPAPAVAFVPGALGQDLFNCFIQDEIKFEESFLLTVGSKLERNDYTGFEVEPSGRIQWNVLDKQMIWVAVSRSVRMPSRYDRDLNDPDPVNPYIFALTSNSTFVSETVIAYELGYRAQLTQQLSGSLSAFYNNYGDLRSEGESITLNDPNSLIQVFYQNNLRAQTSGAELTVDYQISEWWRLHGGYDILKETVWVEPGQSDLSNGLAETADPQNQVFFRSSMDLPGRTELDIAFRWIDSVVTDGLGSSTPSTIPSYAEMDARLGWHVDEHIEISVVGQNLLHDQHIEAGVAGAAQEEIARSVYGKLTCHL